MRVNRRRVTQRRVVVGELLVGELLVREKLKTLKAIIATVFQYNTKSFVYRMHTRSISKTRGANCKL